MHKKKRSLSQCKLWTTLLFLVWMEHQKWRTMKLLGLHIPSLERKLISQSCREETFLPLVCRLRLPNLRRLSSHHKRKCFRVKQDLNSHSSRSRRQNLFSNLSNKDSIKLHQLKRRKKTTPRCLSATFASTRPKNPLLLAVVICIAGHAYSSGLDSREILSCALFANLESQRTHLFRSTRKRTIKIQGKSSHSCCR